MNIDISGHGVAVTNELKQLIDKKFNRLATHHERINNIKVTIKVEHQDHMVHTIINVPGEQINATASSDDMYKSIDLVLPKLSTQLEKYRAKMNG